MTGGNQRGENPMTSMLIRMGVAAASLGAALAWASPAEATQDEIGAFLRRHHVNSDHGWRMRRGAGRHGDPAVYRVIRVEPERGVRSYYAPVRHAPLGDQVRLQSGIWQYCEVTCEYTFRKYGPDFWEGQSESGLSPRALRFDFYFD